MVQARSEELLPLYDIRDSLTGLELLRASKETRFKYESSLWEDKLKRYTEMLPYFSSNLDALLDQYQKITNPTAKAGYRDEILGYQKILGDGKDISEYVREFKISSFEQGIKSVEEKAKNDAEELRKQIDALKNYLKVYEQFAKRAERILSSF